MHMTVISGPERRRRWSAAEREEIVLASFAPGAVIAEVARQFDVSTSLIYNWRRDAQQPEAMFVPAVMAEDEAPVVPEVLGDGLANSPAIRLDLAGGTTVSIAATAPARLILTVLRALR
ncbi:transposase [Devosia sp. SD17-2]|uniref:IS66-like element accessory protein TnpA n=1 Tax=Devosia sp. SD17-2 TaxID=2976459 RepID=UPI0023D84716|nr:transposase [Devosia sp. SD17-2]WEJ32254.1 transposase [Devosia sp. SD17-2]